MRNIVNQRKKEKGITLIALVITIIILLILVAVAIRKHNRRKWNFK